MPKNDDFEVGLVFFRRLSAQITTIASTYDKDYHRFARLLRSIQCDLDKGVHFLESRMSNTELVPEKSLDDQIENTRSHSDVTFFTRGMKFFLLLVIKFCIVGSPLNPGSFKSAMMVSGGACLSFSSSAFLLAPLFCLCL